MDEGVGEREGVVGVVNVVMRVKGGGGVGGGGCECWE